MQHQPHILRRSGSLSEYVRTYFREWWSPRAGRAEGEPVPLGAADRRTWPTLQLQKADGKVEHGTYRYYDPGADAAGYKAGILQRNPIGSGVVFRQHLPIFPRRQADYMAGAINWSTTEIGSTGPAFAPLYTPEQITLLLEPEIYGLK